MSSFKVFNDLAVEELFRQPCLAIPPFRAFSNDLAPEIEPLWKELTWGYSKDLPTPAAFSPDVGDKGSLILRFWQIEGEDDAYAVAHELYHAILNRRDYPTWKPRHDTPSPGLSRVMYKFLNQIQHLLINPALQDYGFGVYDWWQREDWQPFRDSFMWNLSQYVGLLGSPAIFERLETALRWSQLELVDDQKG